MPKNNFSMSYLLELYSSLGAGDFSTYRLAWRSAFETFFFFFLQELYVYTNQKGSQAVMLRPNFAQALYLICTNAVTFGAFSGKASCSDSHDTNGRLVKTGNLCISSGIPAHVSCRTHSMDTSLYWVIFMSIIPTKWSSSWFHTRTWHTCTP